MILSLIVAVSENGVIGRGGDLPWRLSSDLRRFKRLTMGHAIVMGRKTYESIGRPLPGRTSLVISRDEFYRAEGCQVAATLPRAIELTAAHRETFVIGGQQIYALALPEADRLYWTQVHAEVEGDAFFPAVQWAEWRLTADERFPADAKNEFDYSFRIYERVGTEVTPGRSGTV